LAAEELLLFVPDVEAEVKVEVDLVVTLLLVVEVVSPPERTVTLGEPLTLSLVVVEVTVAALSEEVEVPLTIPRESL